MEDHQFDSLSRLSLSLDSMLIQAGMFKREADILTKLPTWKDDVRKCLQAAMDLLDGKTVDHTALPSFFCTILKLLVMFFPPLAPFIATLCP